MGYEPPKRDATVCHWCREEFEPGQVRYIISDAIEAYPCWERVSICGPCWEEYGSQDAPHEPRERFERACGGCGEPIMISGGYHLARAGMTMFAQTDVTKERGAR